MPSSFINYVYENTESGILSSVDNLINAQEQQHQRQEVVHSVLRTRNIQVPSTNNDNNELPPSTLLKTTVQSNNQEKCNSKPCIAEKHINDMTPKNIHTETFGNRRKLHDLPEFSGKPEQWPMFIAAFLETTEAFRYTKFENNIRLQKCIKGEALKAIESLLIFPENIEDAISQLEFLFGRLECLIRSQIAEIRKIQAIDENHIQQIVPFSVKVRNLATFLETTRSTQHLANPLLIEELVYELPMNKRLEWAQYSMHLEPFATVKHFSTWIYQIAQLVSKVTLTSVFARIVTK